MNKKQRKIKRQRKQRRVCIRHLRDQMNSATERMGLGPDWLGLSPEDALAKVQEAIVSAGLMDATQAEEFAKAADPFEFLKRARR